MGAEGSVLLDIDNYKHDGFPFWISFISMLISDKLGAV